MTINKTIRARGIFIDIYQRYPTSIGSTSNDEYQKHPKSMDIYDPLNMQVTLGSLKVAQDVCKCTTSKRIELESPGWSGLVRF